MICQKTYGVHPDEDVTNEYGKEYPYSPGASVETIKEVGSKGGPKRHSLYVSVY
jgi:hypothetical protein